MPMVGSSMMKTRGLVPSHLANSTFCWLPPLSERAGRLRPRRTHPQPGDGLARRRRRSPRCRAAPSRPAKRSSIGRTTFSWIVKSGQDALAQPVVGEQHDAGGQRLARVAQRQRAAVEPDLAAVAARVGAAEDGLGQLGQARAGEAGDAQDLALVQRERDVARAIADAQARAPPAAARPAAARSARRVAASQPAADHRRHHVRQRGVARLRRPAPRHRRAAP